MTLPEKIGLLHSKVGTPFRGEPLPEGAVGSAGFVAGIARLGVPALQESDASLGVTNPADVRPGDGATALPASLGLAATWNPELAYRSGVVIGTEAAPQGHERDARRRHESRPGPAQRPQLRVLQ